MALKQHILTHPLKEKIVNFCCKNNEKCKILIGMCETCWLERDEL